jgi:hypothetical protein
MRLDDGVEKQSQRATDPREALESALALAFRIEQLLNAAGAQSPDNDAFRVRLARAHTLSLVDQLSELVGTRASAVPPAPSGVRECSAKADEDTVGSDSRRDWR